MTLSEYKKQLKADFEAGILTWEDIDKAIDTWSDVQVKDKILAKERYISQVEQDCEDKIANMKLVIRGLKINDAADKKKIERLEQENKVLLADAKRLARFGWFYRVFGKGR